MQLTKRPILFLESPLKIDPCPKSIGVLIEKRCIRPNPAYLEAKRNNPYGEECRSLEQTLEFGWTYFDEAFLYRGAFSFLEPGIQQRIFKFKRVDQLVKAKVSFPVPKLSPNEEQIEAIKALKKLHKADLHPAGNYLFLASTSVGKTILQALAAMYFSQRTLVLCPTTLILKGWEADLIKLFGFASNDLGLIKQNKWLIGKHFTLASPATLHRRKERWEELNKLFGTVIVDEADGVGAPSIFEFVKQVQSRYLIGATATAIDRVGNENPYLRALFGDPVINLNTYGKETHNSISIKLVKMINTDFEYDISTDSINWQHFSESLMLDEDRNNLIVLNAKKEWEQGRIVLLATRRVEHAQILEEMLFASGVKNVNQLNGTTNADKIYTKRLLHGIQTRKTSCIVATMQAIQTGANVPNLDSLHICMPLASTKNLEQLIGRIRRRSEGKKSALVTYYLDKKVGYAKHLFGKVVIPTFRRLKVPGFNIY